MALATVLLLSMMVAFSPSPARADNCEVTELGGIIATVTGQPYEEPGDENAKPQCFVMQQVVYPTLGCTSPADCMQNGVKPLCNAYSSGPPYTPPYDPLNCFD